MCGICGIVQIEGSPRRVVSDETLAAMTDAMTHRGPDDRGVFTADGIALGARRLSIIDVEYGHQPFASEGEDVWAVQNGEIFNHGPLRERLAGNGHRFQSRCDTEILPHLYEEYGTEFPKQMRGMFAVAVWDERRRRAMLVRDRLGVKPLYFARRGDLLLFASELKSLLVSGLIDVRLDHEAIEAYLSFGFVPGPRTPLLGVSKLMPGESLIVEKEHVRTERYWQYPKPTLDGDRTPDEYREGLLEKLEESVRLRLMSDVPLGAMLSGGLDSSLIVGLMARNMDGPVDTFSVGFAEAGKNNELADARHVAEVFGTRHHELELSYTDETLDLEELVWHLDEPVADLSAVAFIALCRLARRHVTVALSGQGADELLGGYPKHRAAAISGIWKRFPPAAQAAGARAAAHAPSRFAREALAFTARDPVQRILALTNQLGPLGRPGLLLRPSTPDGVGAAQRSLLQRLDGVGDHPLAAALYVDAQLGLVDDMLQYFDRASMAYSLEVRVPFLDHELVEFCARIPPGLKVRRLRTKHILKQAARGIVPDRIIDKPKIGFMRQSVGSWFQAQAARAVEDYLLQPQPRYAELLDRGAVERLIRRGLAAPDAPERHLLLSILMLEIWLSTFLPRALPKPASVAVR